MRRPVQHHLAGRLLLRHRVRRGHRLRALLARPLRAVRPDHVVRRGVGHRRADHVAALVPGRANRRRQVHAGRPAEAVGSAGVALRPAGRPVEVRTRNFCTHAPTSYNLSDVCHVSFQVLQAVPARRPAVRQVRGARPLHAASVARILRVNAAVAVAILPAVDGRWRPQTLA